MSAINAYAIQKLPVNSITWEPYIASVNCDNIIFLNGGTDTIKLRTDDAVAGTEITFGPGVQLAIQAPLSGSSNRRAANRQTPYRFMAGDACGYFQSTTLSNVGPVIGMEFE